MLADEEEQDLPDFSLARLKSKNWKCRRNQVKNTASTEHTDLQVDQGEDFQILRFITLLLVTCISRGQRQEHEDTNTLHAFMGRLFFRM